MRSASFASTAALLAVVSLLLGCSGTEVIPDDPSLFASRGFSTYAWRNDPLGDPGISNNQIYTADPVIRGAVNKRMEDLGYREVDRDDAEFLVEYLAVAGINDSRLPRGASNVNPIPTINRLPDGASVDNAYALSGVKTTGNIAVLFVDRSALDIIWKVQISTLIEDANRVDTSRLGDAVRKGLSTLPEAP